MCGIIGYTGQKDSISVIVDGLKKLEYRGYDSTGIAYRHGSKISVQRCKGKIRELETALEGKHRDSNSAIGHTRWATHGRPSVENAHPHRSNGIVIVHNGIIENYIGLKNELAAEGYKFTSETDTEVICHLIHKHSKGLPLEDAIRAAMKDVRGAYAIAAMSEAEPGKIVGLRKDCPLIAGVGEGDYFIASDIPAFLSHTRNVVYLEDGEMAILTPEGINFSNMEGGKIEKNTVQISWSASMAEKGGYKHFMLKEINEQPRAISDTISGRVDVESGLVNLEEFNMAEEALKGITKIHMAACGTSWHSALVGKYLIERLARVPVEVDIASEFRYREPLVKKGDLFISITQSGETADTLAAQRLAKGLGAATMCICNVIGSTAAREADAVFYTRSGPEIGVASTKAFTTQLTGFYLLAVALGRIKGVLSKSRASGMLGELLKVPDKIEKSLSVEPSIERIAKDLYRKPAFLYLGRGINYPIAYEGALKLKEISYIHAEAYPAGEMKHGPIALIDEGFPVLVLAPRGELYEKIDSNIHEIKSRGGKIIMVTTGGPDEHQSLSADYVVRVPEADSLVMPMLMAVPLQLLAYHIGVLRGCDVDQPRNLAKSVTVE